MATVPHWVSRIREGGYDSAFRSLYARDEETVRKQRNRYADALLRFGELYGRDRDVGIYSVPGRAELCGNHTDHNNGVVMAAAVNLDLIAVVSRSDAEIVAVRSQGFGDIEGVSLSRLDPVPEEKGKSAAIIRGVARGVLLRGGKVGGIDAYVASDVLKGSGLSSSAAFEVAVGAIFNGEYNGGRFSPVDLALIGQAAENTYFGKPSGLMDQMACAVGGMLAIDFLDPSAPSFEKISLDLSAHGFKLVVTDTKGDHSDLTPDYAAIRREMEDAARFFGKKNLREVERGDFLKRLPAVREKTGDRAVLRALHFFEENRRVGELADAIRDGDMERFTALIVESGNSSFEYNQNAYSIRHPEKQGLSVGLALSQLLLNGRGAWRLQGGGFAGTIQAFVPDGLTERYCSAMDGVFGEGASRTLLFREAGCINMTRYAEDVCR